MGKVLVAGATGYLGAHITRELIKREQAVRVLVRSPQRLPMDLQHLDDCVQGEVTQADSLDGCCRGIDCVISSIGITRQKDGLSYMDVDYQGNLNLLRQAQQQGVKKFVYVSVFHGDKLRELKICDAKEKFVDALKQSGLEYCIIRPNGFFSDMTEFYEMAKKGRIYLFGTGQWHANPIHGADLAQVCVDALFERQQEVEVGGPDVLSQKQIAEAAFSAIDRPVKITYLPDWIRRGALWAARTFTNSKGYGPIEFFLTVLSQDMVAPQHGQRRLREYYASLNDGLSEIER